MSKFIYTDGGREAAGYKGETRDCVTRAIAVAARQDYQTVYDILSKGNRTQRVTARSKRRASARDGVQTQRKLFKDYMHSLGFVWLPTMRIGQGCTVHLTPEELPPIGNLVVKLSRHFTAVIDGVIYDTNDPSRNGTRCVYGFWIWEGDLTREENLDAGWNGRKTY